MKLYLGIDSSTQGVKAEVIDLASGRIAGSFAVNFGRELPSYGSPNGFLPCDDELVRRADPLMWLDGLELLFEKMRKSGLPLAEIEGISGSGQQHGSVYLNADFPKTLSGLAAGEGSLAQQLKKTLSRKVSPIWMDKSTASECAEMTARFGAEKLRRITGSVAIERFTASQIRKFYHEDEKGWQNTAFVHLVSSFLCSALCGKSAPIDCGDGAGMNLLDLNTLRWNEEIVDFIAPGLAGKLPEVKLSSAIAGGLSPYFERYGFRSGTPVAVWSGDNPNSLVGMGASAPGTAVASLGTSDTFFAAMRDFKVDPEGYGHVFGNPGGGFMSLSCFTNGSLAREKVREMTGLSWPEFDAAPLKGSGRKLLLPYFEAESTPLRLKSGVKYDFDAASASAADLARAIFESQALSLKLHSRWIGRDFQKLRLTGGASNSAGFCQVLADVFGADAEVIGVSNSAGLGAAMRAANAVGNVALEELYPVFCAPVKVYRADAGKRSYYREMLERYAALEKSSE